MVEIEKFLTISTAHIKSETADWLDEQATKGAGANLVTFRKGKYGWFVYVKTFAELGIDKTALIPKDLHYLAGYATANDCYWLQIDKDVEPSDSLPILWRD